MKASIFDVLMYLFDIYFEDDFEITSDRENIKNELILVGFGENQVEKAFEWLEALACQKNILQTGEPPGRKSMRIFNAAEIEKLNTDCRGFIMFLEQTGILDACARELVIDRVTALETEEIDLVQLKWVVLMVLLNQPGKEAAYAWMEDIIMEDMEVGLH